MSAHPPNDCPECKVVINGGVSARVLDETCKFLYDKIEKGYIFPNIKDLVVKANEIEDLVFRFERATLEGAGFRGPWPHSLDFKK